MILASKTNRLDLGGIDRPGAKDHHLQARIDILAETNECFRKRICRTDENVKNSLELAGKYDKRRKSPCGCEGCRVFLTRFISR
jgi:hypothetical protein